MPMLSYLSMNGGDGSVLYAVTLIVLLIAEIVAAGWMTGAMIKDWAEERRKKNGKS